MQVQQALVGNPVGGQATGQVRRERLLVKAPAGGGKIDLCSIRVQGNGRLDHLFDEGGKGSAGSTGKVNGAQNSRWFSQHRYTSWAPWKLAWQSRGWAV